MKTTRLLAVIWLGFVAAACEHNYSADTPSALTPLAKLLSDHGYELLKPPRAEGVLGFILASDKPFASGIVDSACVLPSEIAKGRSLKVQARLAETQYLVSSNADVELGLGNVLEGTVKLDAVFNDVRVKSVQVKIDEPYLMRLEGSEIQSFVDSLDPTHRCFSIVRDKGNGFVSNIMGVKGLQYEFIGSNGTALEIDSKIIDQIGLDVDVGQYYLGKTALDIGKEMTLAVIRSPFPEPITEPRISCGLSIDKDAALKILREEFAETKDDRVSIWPDIAKDAFRQAPMYGFRGSDLLLAVDNTLSENFSQGLLIATDGVYFRDVLGSAQRLCYVSIRSAEFNNEILGDSVLINGKETSINLSDESDRTGPAIVSSIERILDALKLR